MKKLITLLTTLFVFNLTWGQVDNHGNPIFNNIELSKDDHGEFELTSSYYTIDNNIANKETSVYVSDTPTKEEYLKFSRDLPSYFFIVHKGPTVFAMIMLLPKNEGTNTTLSYNIINPNTGKSIETPCRVWGEISEKRANELLELKVDSTAKIIDLPNNGKGLLFNGMTYRIQSYDKLKEEVTELAKQLMASQAKIDNPEEYIKKETVGGKLDFNKILKKEQQAFFLHDGVAYNKKDFAIFLWGKAVNRLEVKSSKSATKLWEKIHHRRLTASEAKALKKGFESKKDGS